MNEQIRKEFEEWWDKAGFNTQLLRWQGNDHYRDGTVQIAWQSYKAARARYAGAHQPKVPEGWKFSRIGDDHIQVEHPDTSTICIADKGPINNMMFYELCLAMLSASQSGKGE